MAQKIKDSVKRIATTTAIEVPTLFTFHGCDEIRESFGSPLHSVFSRGRDVLNRAARTDEQSRAGLVRGAIKEI